jgi:hypothetical protein
MEKVSDTVTMVPGEPFSPSMPSKPFRPSLPGSPLVQEDISAAMLPVTNKAMRSCFFMISAGFGLNTTLRVLFLIYVVPYLAGHIGLLFM